MKKIIAIFTAFLLIVFLSVGVMADDLPTDEDETDENGEAVVSADSGEGEFSGGELPEFVDDDGGLIFVETEIETESETERQNEPQAEELSGQTEETPSGTNAAIPIVIAACAVAAGGAITAVTVIRKKRDPSRKQSGETK